MGIVKDMGQLTAAAELRRKAEERLQAESVQVHPPRYEDVTDRLVHELQVHEIELEMQLEELRQARSELESALERCSDLYDFAPVGYLTLDRNGIIRAANLTGSGLTGVARSRLIGRRFELYIPVETRSVFIAFLAKVFTEQSKEACQVPFQSEGNSEKFLQIEGVAAASGKECRIALIDITERKMAEKALHQAKAAAEALQREKDAAEEAANIKNLFFANMSHELRTPMTGILGMLQLALEEDPAPTLREYLEISLRSARSLLQILNDILDMSRIEAGKLTIEENPFSLRRFITAEVEIMTPEVRRKGTDFVVSVAEEVPDMVVGDQTRLRQVLLNLIGNAIKFTKGGKVEMRVTAGRTTSNGKLEITFAVTDTGIGISDDKKELLFKAFSQADASHSRIYGGTGLGLAICKEIVELMGGTITFESKEGVGSTFSFTIPLVEAGSECVTTIRADYLLPETIIPAAVEERRPRLLLAEDNPDSRMVFELMLQRANYDVDIAEDGLMAVELWEKGEYDLLLMDVQMPRLNGFEATRAIREKERGRGGHTPIVALTAHAGKEDEKRCLAAGMDTFISKPIDFIECLRLIGQTIKQKASGVS